MRIGIVTIHYNFDNLGCMLQASSLQQVLKSHCDNVDIIDHRYPGKLQAIGPIRTLSHLESIRFIETMDRSPTFLSETVEETEQYMANNYDMLFYGSDEVWKYGFTPDGKQPIVSYRTPIPNIYWPPQTLKIPHFAYAACEGNSQQAIPKQLIEPLGSSLRAFTDIGVRDNRTAELVKHLTGEKPKRVPDPVFLYDHSAHCDQDHVRYKLEKAGADFNKSVVGIYAHTKTEFPASTEMSFVNLKGAALNAPEFWCAAGIVDIMLTDTYHGTVTALVHNTPCVHLKNIPPKVRELRKRFAMPTGDLSTVEKMWPHDLVAETALAERNMGLAWIEQAVLSNSKV